MILIADSGSTKTDWRIIDENGKVASGKTTGFNPYFHSSESIEKELRSSSFLSSSKKKISEIHFYGAGCSTKKNVSVVKKALSKVFVGAKINVDHDLTGAARAVCGGSSGVVAILGTGSNSALYDGNNIIDNSPSLGYFFGDEGSGAYLGKKLLKLYLNNELPKNLSNKFSKEPKFRKELILTAVYSKPNPNRFLASYAKGLTKLKKDPYIYDLIYISFCEFFDRHVCKYPNYEYYTFGCVGSIGYYFKDILTEAASDKGVKIGNIMKSPIGALVRYHKNS